MAEEFIAGRPKAKNVPCVVFECPKSYVILGEDSNGNRQEGVLKNSIRYVPIHAADQGAHLSYLQHKKKWKCLGVVNWGKGPILDKIASGLDNKSEYQPPKEAPSAELAAEESSSTKGRAEQEKEEKKVAQAQKEKAEVLDESKRIAEGGKPAPKEGAPAEKVK